ncbi:putative N6-adenine methyltransferase-domain-containing protein [Pyronema domesticum]|nr:putative N6-adenine methyltransferase-domain-containing protein [Pyronema domesticum]
MTFEDDEELQLPADTLNLLAEFMKEKDEQERRFEDLKKKAEQDHEDRIASMLDFTEDWNQSQFWYEEKTACELAESLMEGATDDMVIGLVSAPTVYVKLREWKQTGKISKNITIKLFEYDQRFAVFKDDFVAYDFQRPLHGLPSELKGKFDRVLIDPPFLSEDCQTKTALTVRWLTKPWTPVSTTTSSSSSDSDNSATSDSNNSTPVQRTRIMTCTGERMKDIVRKLYKQAGIQITTLEVRHANQLNNDFRCYANWENKYWGFNMEE